MTRYSDFTDPAGIRWRQLAVHPERDLRTCVRLRSLPFMHGPVRVFTGAFVHACRFPRYPPKRFFP